MLDDEQRRALVDHQQPQQKSIGDGEMSADGWRERAEDLIRWNESLSIRFSAAYERLEALRDELDAERKAHEETRAERDTIRTQLDEARAVLDAIDRHLETRQLPGEWTDRLAAILTPDGGEG